MGNLARYTASDLPALLDRISKNSIGMHEYLDRVFDFQETTEVDGAFVHKGLAQRSFKRVWTVSDDTKIGSVEFVDGLLSVELNKIVPEHHSRKDYI